MIVNSGVNGVDALELELRRLPGVEGVGFDERGEALVVHLHAPAVEDGQRLRRQAVLIGRSHLDRPLTVELGGGGDQGRSGRIQLLAVRELANENEIEVHLGHGGRRTVGRAPRGSLDAPVLATLDALQGLGAPMPFEIDDITVVDQPEGGAVVVVLTRTDSSERRLGVGAGDTTHVAASRATLHALNRFLEKPGVLSSD